MVQRALRIWIRRLQPPQNLCDPLRCKIVCSLLATFFLRARISLRLFRGSFLRRSHPSILSTNKKREPSPALFYTLNPTPCFFSPAGRASLQPSSECT